MPSLDTTYEILLDLTNDMNECVSVQLLRDYGRQAATVVLLKPTENLSLILESGLSYQYAIKLHTKVANVTARSWRDITCYVSQIFTVGGPTDSSPTNSLSGGGCNRSGDGVRVDRIWRDHRFNIWNESLRTENSRPSSSSTPSSTSSSSSS